MEYEGKMELDIHIEPWDYYLLFDSKIFMKLLNSNVMIESEIL